jgi:hypothetical protein
MLHALPMSSSLISSFLSNTPYILKTNPHLVFGGFLKGKKLVRGSNLLLSSNCPLPTGRLIE